MIVGALLLLLGAPQQADPVLLELTPNRHGHRAHVVGQLLVVVGGNRAGDASRERGTRDALTYSFETRQWSELPRLAQSKSFFGSAVVEGTVHAVGTNIERWSPGDKHWTTVCEDERLPSSHFSVVAAGGTLYVLGKELLAFDIKTQKLSQIESYPGMKSGDHFELFAAVGNDLHVIGGLDGDSFEQRKSHWRLRKGEWQRMPDAPMSIFTKFAAVEVVGRSVFFMSADGSLRWDEETGQWKKLARMPQNLAMPASFLRDGWIHILGGLAVEGTLKPMAYSISEDRWTSGG